MSSVGREAHDGSWPAVSFRVVGPGGVVLASATHRDNADALVWARLTVNGGRLQRWIEIDGRGYWSTVFSRI